MEYISYTEWCAACRSLGYTIEPTKNQPGIMVACQGSGPNMVIKGFFNTTGCYGSFNKEFPPPHPSVVYSVEELLDAHDAGTLVGGIDLSRMKGDGAEAAAILRAAARMQQAEAEYLREIRKAKDERT